MRRLHQVSLASLCYLQRQSDQFLKTLSDPFYQSHLLLQILSVRSVQSHLDLSVQAHLGLSAHLVRLLPSALPPVH